MELIWFLIIGAVAGWLAGLVMKGSGMGLIGNLIVGVIGAFIGGWVLAQLGFSFGGLPGSLFTAFIGAVILLFLVGLIKKS